MSDETEKIWDHPWTTDEMRQYRSDWSLAGDVGLLKHLQQFSENLTATVKNTQTTLDLLNNQLNETTVLIDNVTNASLALANTQFIESRVYDDDTDNKDQQDNITKTDKKELPNIEIMSETEMIAAVSENIQQGLAIMDEKYERLEVISSDSEDENELPQPSFILRPKDPYQNRPLPYVIDTDKWKTSSKIGLESSSSESEIIDDDDDDDNDEEDTESNKDMDELSQHIFIENSRRISILRRTSSSSSESSDFDEKSITNKHYSNTRSHTDNKLHTRSQDTLNSTSELTTPTIGLPRDGENSIRDTPSFAEELAKRLGSVMPKNKTTVEKRNFNEASINRHSKADIFANYGNKNSYKNDKGDSDVDHHGDDDDDDDDDDEHIFSDRPDNLFSGGGGLFDDDGEVSNSLWKNNLVKRPQTHIIPPNIDVPPPMHSTVTKPNSNIDDLFGDDDSDNSDDIFAPKNSTKSIDTVDIMKDNAVKSNITDNKLLSTVQQKNTDKMATSTPESQNIIPDLFVDNENDENIFGSPHKSINNKSVTSRNPQRDRPPGLFVSQSDLLSSNLGSKLFQRAHQESSSSSENMSEEPQQSDNKSETSNTTRFNENSNVSTSNASIREAGNPMHIETSDSSGISIHPQSMNSTLSLGGTNNWTPQMESTRLASEELYRDRVTSDSLLNTNTRQQISNNSGAGVISNNQSLSNRIRDSSNVCDDNLFDNDDDDVFSPPPLPKNKSKSGSKVTSLFDDSDSGDDLFSNTSSGSRSQKSADILTNLTQQQLVEKSKSGQKRGGLFDDGIDIFTNRNASSDVDISTSRLTSKDENQLLKHTQSSIESNKQIEKSESISKTLSTHFSESTSVKPTSIFDDSETEDEDLFSSIIHSKPVVNKFNDENKLFAISSVSSENHDEVLTVPKKDFTVSAAVVVGDENKVQSEEYKRNNNQILATNKILNSRVFAASENKLFDDSDDNDDDDDNLFNQKQLVAPQIKSNKNQVDEVEKLNDKSDSIVHSVQPQIESMESLNKFHELDVTHSNVDENKDSVLITNDEKTSDRSENTVNPSCATHPKRQAPKSLKIRLPIAGTSEDPNPPPRRAVSGKIKNLMGKMGDLKILSPTDTPLSWRKNSGNTNSEDDDNILDRDSEDGSSISVPSTKSLPTLPKEKIVKNESPQSPLIETETAVGFDLPAQADTLTVTASKSRVRIPVKRRPQSRHARQSALRLSGIDFDTVDTVDESSSITINSNEISHSYSKVERLVISNDGSDGDGDGSLARPVKPTLNLMVDDKSEISLGKESSVSITKNTLLSPSTDEEDLFDVPPDLPEDSQKEDSLFGRAPILSPVTSCTSAIERDLETSEELIKNKMDCDTAEKLLDPLRDNSHDPLKDPSQLFAFVTKTPSPEKGQNSLFMEDDSLFSQTIKKGSGDTESVKKSFDIFADDSSGDLFSGPFTKATTKKSIKGNKSNLFNDLDSDDDDDDDATDDLFGSASSKRSNQSKSEHSDIDINEVVNASSGNSPKQIDAFDDDDEDLFFDASEKLSSETGKDDQVTSPSSKITKAKLEDIFGDQSGGEDDIFTVKKPIGIGASAGGLFFTDDNDDDTSDIFTKKSSLSSVMARETVENRVPMKKTVTRDLRKTAEKIVEDPLSMLNDD